DGHVTGVQTCALPIFPNPYSVRSVAPYHWWRTVFYLIPVFTVYTIVLGAASIVSSLFDRHGSFAHGCARAWSWLILKTTGVRVRSEERRVGKGCRSSG